MLVASRIVTVDVPAATVVVRENPRRRERDRVLAPAVAVPPVDAVLGLSIIVYVNVLVPVLVIA